MSSRQREIALYTSLSNGTWEKRSKERETRNKRREEGNTERKNRQRKAITKDANYRHTRK
jgi:hypothetical protein